MNLINEWYTLTLNSSETYRADGLVISVFPSTKFKTFQNDFVMPFKILKICYGLKFDQTELKTVFKDPVL